MNETFQVRGGSMGGVARRRGERRHECESTRDHGSQTSSCSAIPFIIHTIHQVAAKLWVHVVYKYSCVYLYTSFGKDMLLLAFLYRQKQHLH